MTRKLIPALVLFAAGFSTEVLAETDTDIPAESALTDLSVDDAAAKKAKKRAGKKSSRAPATKQPATAPRASRSHDKPKASRPAAPAASSERQAAHKRPASKKRPADRRPPAANNNHQGAHQVHRNNYVPARWTPNYHRYHMNGVPRHHPRYWGAGVFYYNPPPAGHKVVVVNENGQAARGPEPTRAFDRSNSFGVGLSAGSYNSGYKGGGEFGDMGIGLSATYRPVEAVGFEIAWTHYDQSWDESSDRVHEAVQASVNLYAFPWTRVSPYVTLGVTQTGRDIQDTWFDGLTEQSTTTVQTVFGPHAGLGVEFAMGSAAALDLEARYVSYLDMEEGDPSAASAVQGTMGLKFYF